MFGYLVAAVWLFLPAGLANATPVIASKLPLLKAWRTPLDGGHSYRGQRLLGDNKTVRGVVFGTAVAMLVAALQHAAGHITDLPALTLRQAVLAGGLMGFGALMGDAVESFFKRQRGVKPGDGWFPFDQLDYIVGGLLLSYPVIMPSWPLIAAVVLCWFGLHIATVFVCYKLGIREKPI